jgi:hypothetical protein
LWSRQLSRPPTEWNFSPNKLQERQICFWFYPVTSLMWINEVYPSQLNKESSPAPALPPCCRIKSSTPFQLGCVRHSNDRMSFQTSSETLHFWILRLACV